MAKKVSELIEMAQKNNTGRKTKNNELYYDILLAICEDSSYVAKNVAKIENGKIFTEDRKLSEEFKEIIASAIKKASGCTEAEALTLAESFKLNKKQAKTISDIVHESDYVAMKDCNKKVQLFNKKGFSITASINEAPSVTRQNPQDPKKVTVISKRDRLKIQQKLHDFQKSVKKA